MPPRRSSRAVSKEDTKEDVKIAKQDDSAQQTIMLLNEQVFSNDANSPVFCQLKHPKTERAAMFLIPSDDSCIYEVQSFNEEFRSWIIDSTIVKDGKIIFTTPLDPLFLMLPYLEEADKSGKFMTIDQIIADEKFPECRRLCTLATPSQLKEISDVKGDDTFQAYRFNKDKTFSWLKKKVGNVAAAFEERKLDISGLSTSANYVKSKKGSVTTKDDYIRFAHGLVSDYLSEDLSSALREFLNIPVIVPKRDVENEEPPAKRQKTDKTAPNDDYSKQKNKAKGPEEKKLTTAQKKLSSIDKTGMKSLSSFFSPKPK